mgnify:CR=1 FL=1
MNTGILNKLQNHWKNDNPDIRKGTLRALGVLTQHQKCAQWTVRQNLIPDLIEYLNNTDPDFVIYAAVVRNKTYNVLPILMVFVSCGVL